MSRRTLALLSAGLSQPSSTRLLADRLTNATQRELERLGHDVLVEPVELRDHAHDLINNMLTGFPSESLRGVIDAVTGADGLVAVSPIFSASYSGLFKSFFDVIDQDSLTGMPVLIGATGGTARHSLALEHAVRPLFAHLRSIVVPTAVFAATADFGGAGPGGSGSAGSDAGPETPLDARVDRAGRELAALVAATLRQRPIGPFDAAVSFEQLLAGGAAGR